MSLLREIQNSAIDGSTDLETLLRKCRVLAARLKNDEFKQWVQWELDGYPANSVIPDYRKFHGHCFGHFAGAFQSGMRNAPIPEMNIPEDIREALTHISFRDGVSSIRDLIESCDDDTGLRMQWPADAAVLFGREIYERMNLMQGWLSISKSAIVGILSTVRNRILNFALEIEESNPDAGEAAPGTLPLPKEVVSQIVNYHIYGNVGNVASGKDIQQTATVNIQQGDFKNLADLLREHGVEEDEIGTLENAIKSDPIPSRSNKTLGKKVSAWLGKMLQKSAEGTWKIATTAAADLLTRAINSYYGLPPKP